MKHLILHQAIAALMTLAVASCGFSGHHREENGDTAQVEIMDLTAEAMQWADSVTMRMDTARLGAQVLMPALYASDDLWTVALLQRYAREGIGGIILLKGTVEEARTLADSMRRVSAVDPFVAIDAEWGLNMRLADAPKFPANGRLSPKVQDQLMYDYGREVARECRQIGINMVLGPVLDVTRRDSYVGVRSFGSDPRRVSDLGLAYGKGLSGGGVMPVAKHFPGHGTVRTDSHKGKGVIDGSLQRLDTVDLVPFRAWSAAGMPAVMVGHLAVPAIDSKMLPAAVSSTIISDLLRGDLKFSGLVLTDAMNMLGAEGYTAADALRAGSNLILAPADTHGELAGITESVRRGTLPLDTLRQRVRLILFHKYLLRRAPDIPESVSTPQADSLARELSEL